MKFTTDSLYYFIASLIIMMVFCLCFTGINTHVSVSQIKTFENIYPKDTINIVHTWFSADNKQEKENQNTKELQNTDSVIKQVNYPENGWYWFISINVYPNKFKNN